MYWASLTLCSNTVLPDMLAPVITVGPVVRRMFTGWNRFPAASSEIRNSGLNKPRKGVVLRYRGTGKALPRACIALAITTSSHPIRSSACCNASWYFRTDESLSRMRSSFHAAEIELLHLRLVGSGPVCVLLDLFAQVASSSE